jgi:hypothetical protein
MLANAAPNWVLSICDGALFTGQERTRRQQQKFAGAWESTGQQAILWSAIMASA